MPPDVDSSFREAINRRLRQSTHLFRPWSVSMKRPALLVLTSMLFAASVSAEDWPGWRGPRGDGTSEEKNVPLEWSATKNVRWKEEIPGVGHASPIVSG